MIKSLIPDYRKMKVINTFALHIKRRIEGLVELAGNVVNMQLLSIVQHSNDILRVAWIDQLLAAV